MRKCIFLCVASLWLIAARAPAPTDPVAVYVEGVQVLATEAAATIIVTGLKSLLPTTQRTVHTGKTFWVEVYCDVGAGGTVLNFSGSLYYDSLLVRPTGRLRNPSERALDVQLTDGTARAGECGVAPADHAAIAGISWTRIEGVGNYDAHKPTIQVEFLALSAGTATFTWTDPFTDCQDATVADGDFDRKPHGVIWERDGSYFTAVASDGGSYANADLSVTIEGATKGKGYFWKANPESLETYIDLGGNISASDGDTVSVPVSIWYPFELGQEDAIRFSFVWETQELRYIGAVSASGWMHGTGDIEGEDYDLTKQFGSFKWSDMLAAGISTTAVCGLDSAAAGVVVVRPVATARQAAGTVLNLRFLVLRDGNATVRLGCRIGDVPAVADADSYIPFSVSASYLSGDRTYLMRLETEQQSWRWRFGSNGVVVVQ